MGVGTERQPGAPTRREEVAALVRGMIAEGTLVRGASRESRLRVPADSADRGAWVPLSVALAARRRAAGLTQPELADRLGVSLTMVGHAETGRLWQARRFWECADAVLGAAGTLLDLYDRHHAADGLTAEEPPEPPEPSPAALWPVSIGVSAAGVLVVWPDGTQNLVTPPGGQPDE